MKTARRPSCLHGREPDLASCHVETKDLGVAPIPRGVPETIDWSPIAMADLLHTLDHASEFTWRRMLDRLLELRVLNEYLYTELWTEQRERRGGVRA